MIIPGALMASNSRVFGLERLRKTTTVFG